MRITGTASFYYKLCSAVVLCPQEFADPPSQIWLDLSVRACDTHETSFIPFLIEILSEQITIFCFSSWVPGVCVALGTLKPCTCAAFTDGFLLNLRVVYV